MEYLTHLSLQRLNGLTEKSEVDATANVTSLSVEVKSSPELQRMRNENIYNLSKDMGIERRCYNSSGRSSSGKTYSTFHKYFC